MRSNIFKLTGLTIFIALLTYVLITYFNELNQAEEFNQFLSDAATISEIHNLNSENFRELSYQIGDSFLAGAAMVGTIQATGGSLNAMANGFNLINSLKVRLGLLFLFFSI